MHPSRAIARSRRIYLIPSHDCPYQEALCLFLKAVGLEAIRWPGIGHILNSARPLDRELLEQAFSGAQAIVVVLTGEDLGQPNPNLPAPRDSKYARSRSPQPRPDTLFEAGIALGVAPERTILIQLGKLRPMKRVWRRELVVLDNSIRSKRLLLERLTEMGCAVEKTSRRWVDAGDFEALRSQPLHSEKETRLEELETAEESLNLPTRDRDFLQKFEALLRESVTESVTPEWVAKRLRIKNDEIVDHLIRLVALGIAEEHKQIGSLKYSLSSLGRKIAARGRS